MEASSARPEAVPAEFEIWMAARAALQGFELDAAQRGALQAFDRIERELAAANGKSWMRFLRNGSRPVRGVYLWGGVGRGKSFLMDGYFDYTAEPRKRRDHFHRFMQGIHHDLKRLQGQAEPLRAVAERLASEARLLCLDEFQVTDIGDAMLMRKLLEGLFERDVTLVTTSNTPPRELYLHGLQRAQFLPAIDLLEQHLDVLQMDGGTDYRQRVLEQAGTWHTPVSEASTRALSDAFLHIAGTHGPPQTLDIEGRDIEARMVVGGVAWFDFETLCCGPRAQADYIELARRFHTVILDGVPRFPATGAADRMRRLTWLVDEFYDRRVKLVVAAQAPAPEIFADVAPASERDRTASRLVEMQTHQYLGAAHLG